MQLDHAGICMVAANSRATCIWLLWSLWRWASAIPVVRQSAMGHSLDSAAQEATLESQQKECSPGGCRLTGCVWADTRGRVKRPERLRIAVVQQVVADQAVCHACWDGNAACQSPSHHHRHARLENN